MLVRLNACEHKSDYSDGECTLYVSRSESIGYDDGTYVPRGIPDKRAVSYYDARLASKVMLQTIVR